MKHTAIHSLPAHLPYIAAVVVVAVVAVVVVVVAVPAHLP